MMRASCVHLHLSQLRLMMKRRHMLTIIHFSHTRTPQLEELRLGNARRLLSIRGLPSVYPRLTSLEVRGARCPLDFGVLEGLTGMTKLALGPYNAGDVRIAELNPRGRLDDGLYHSGTDFRYKS